MGKKLYLIGIITILYVALFCLTGYENAQAENSKISTVFLGRFEQDNNIDNGPEPIEWYVIDEKEDKALLLSRFILCGDNYNKAKKDITYLSSSIRSYLNKELFLEAFTEEERNIILETKLNNKQSGDPEWYYATYGGNDTEDSLFLISYADLYNLPALWDRNIRAAEMTEYAKKNGAKKDWWMRSPGLEQHDACYMSEYGFHSTIEVNAKIGVRPAIWIDKSLSRKTFPYEQYKLAEKLANNGSYGEAATIMDTLGTYYNSNAIALEYHYQHAVSAKRSEDYETALRVFLDLDNYKDSYEQVKETRYAIAEKARREGNYQKAVEALEALGNYKNSISLLKDTYNHLGISVYYFSANPVETGTNNGYSGANIIKQDNWHYGWRLGQFFMSDFTRIMNTSSEQPMFIKVLGDSITLWFDIQQNIDALNNDASKSIAEDNGGYDQMFEIGKTNFGRGTLIIRHTDYQNHKSEPQIYTNYLKANDGTNDANTKVVIHEEGDYEVALDYKIKNVPRKWVGLEVVPEFKDYRVSFKFSVRNGNCMIYPMDAITKAELSNVAITPNGFYLDLARSRYLDIDVKRTVFQNGHEDVRFNRPAKDGDKYTQEGIYTIAVSNRYTGESTIKTIFVGTDELLKQYLAEGFSMDRLN